jgi:hypothetical protein
MEELWFLAGIASGLMLKAIRNCYLKRARFQSTDEVQPSRPFSWQLPRRTTMYLMPFPNPTDARSKAEKRNKEKGAVALMSRIQQALEERFEPGSIPIQIPDRVRTFYGARVRMVTVRFDALVWVGTDEHAHSSYEEVLRELALVGWSTYDFWFNGGWYLALRGSSK